MAVDHGQMVVVILLADKTAGILAKSAHLVFKGLGITNQLGLIQHVVHLLHDLVAHFHPHTDIHRTRLMSDSVAGAQLLQPVGAPAAGGNYRMLRPDVLLLPALSDGNARTAFAFQQQILTVPPEQDLHTVIQ